MRKFCYLCRSDHKTKLYVTTVNNSFQPLPIFRHKELHLRFCVGLELSIVISTKILKGMGAQTPRLHPINNESRPVNSNPDGYQPFG